MSELECPSCGEEIDPIEVDTELITYWGEQCGEYREIDCPFCAHTFRAREIVDRSFEIIGGAGDGEGE